MKVKSQQYFLKPSKKLKVYFTELKGNDMQQPICIISQDQNKKIFRCLQGK